MKIDERDPAGARVRRRMRERGFEMPSSWPLIDWETGEIYWPGDRYLDRLLKQIRKRQGEALMVAVHGVIAEERSGAWGATDEPSR